MNQDCISFEISSITHAQKARRLLKQEGVRSDLQRSTGGLDGCGYRLRVYTNPDEAERLLKRAGVSHHGTAPCR